MHDPGARNALSLAGARRHWPVGVMGLMLLLGLSVAFNMGGAVGDLHGGFLPDRNHLTSRWKIDSSTPPWWPVLASGRLRYDDVLVALEGERFGPEAQGRYAEAWQAGRASVTLTVQRQGAALPVTVPIRRFAFGNFLDLKLSDFINGFGFWLLSLAVYRARPLDPVSRAFALATSLGAGTVWITTPGLCPEAGLLTRALHLAWAPTICLFGALFVHNAMLFPEPVEARSRRGVWALYAYAGTAAAVYALSMLARWRPSPAALADSLSAAGHLGMLSLYGLAVGVYGGRLLYLLRRPASSRRLRRQVVLLLLGLAAALPYVLIQLLRSFGSRGDFWRGLDLRSLVLPIPISFAFVILRYRAYQRMHPTVLGVLILMASALLAEILVWVLRSTDAAGAAALSWSPFVPLFAAALFSGVFWSIQLSSQGPLARLFQGRRRGYGAIQQFGREVLEHTDPSPLSQAIAAALVRKLELERAGVWLWNDKQEALLLAAHAGTWPDPPAASLERSALPRSQRPIRVPAAGSVAADGLEPWWRSGAIEVVAPLWVSGRTIGLVGLGKRWDEEIFDERDLDIVELVAQQAALFLLTALQVEQLRQVPHQIAATQERERFKIAQELHDTIQQFLGRLPFYLEVSKTAARRNPGDTEAILDRCLVDVESAAQTVRQIRHNLAPLQLERSLVEPLRALFDHFQSRTGIRMEVTLSGEADGRLTVEARHALYRVVQQALDNVAAHAAAARVTVLLGPEEGRIRLTVADDGCGFSDHERARAEEGGGFGLKSMAARLTSLGGEFGIESAPGLGTRVMGWLPMAADAPPAS